MQHNWYNNIDAKYVWVKGHVARGDQDPNCEEQFNIEADALCDLIR
jgi:hypothetical protein